MTKFIGEKYEETKYLDIAEVAKLVRKDLKEAFPSYKFSVRIERSTYSQALRVSVKNTGMKNHSYDPEGERAIGKLKSEIRQVIYAYNYDDSDSMTDYFSTKFYDSIQFED